MLTKIFDEFSQPGLPASIVRFDSIPLGLRVYRISHAFETIWASDLSYQGRRFVTEGRQSKSDFEIVMFQSNVSITEPRVMFANHEIMVHFVLRKLILQTRASVVI